MKSITHSAFERTPGWEIVSQGLRDISQGKNDTVEALLVFMASPRLNSLGFEIPDCPWENSPERIHQKLYQLLQKSAPDPYSQFNALQRRLISFCASLESYE